MAEAQWFVTCCPHGEVAHTLYLPMDAGDFQHWLHGLAGVHRAAQGCRCTRRITVGGVVSVTLRGEAVARGRPGERGSRR